ncbi:MAG: GNAT family N-acetyltransferase [Cyclobacteriaceae bacterium]|nr:GNAT family N-acetyltransferase [Cyclobacteriaceae bacterium]
MTEEILRTDSSHPDFISLVVELDKDLAGRYGDSQKFFNQFNKLDKIRHVVIVYRDGRPVGCGAMKKYDDTTMEIKRMFVSAEHRSQGIAGRIMDALETWAMELNLLSCILETAKKQPEAMHLYEKSGYFIIPNYDQYIGVEISVCMRKNLLQGCPKN